jgi:glyceraldehyde 3-phosphate dehydrogenase
MNNTTFGINGFGRIGRTTLRVWWQYYRDQATLGLINTSGSMEIEEWAHLLKYDTNYGQFQGEIKVERTQSKKDASDENSILGTITLQSIESGESSVTIVVTAQRDPAKIPWSENNVTTVIESTGVFRDKEKAALHLQGGAKNVIITAPTKGEGISHSVIGVQDIDFETNQIASNESCTTNCVAPVIALLHQKIGIEKAFLTTIHSYTDDQNTQDNSHKKDMRRARAAAENIIPTSTGAAKATTEIIPELKGIFDGLAVRVPTAVGSLSDIVFVSKRDVTVEEINDILTEASQADRWKGILAVTNDPIVSSDIVGRRESSIVDLELTNVMGGNLVKVIAWYDNEYGYCNRLVEQIIATA